ncbi:glycosyltransferase family 4 protein [Chloroflexota bacterium]
MMDISILHYAAPPIVGGVESTIFHHSRLLSNAGYDVSVIAGRGENFNDNILLHLIPEIDSRHPEVIDIGSALASGEVLDEFTHLRDSLFQKLMDLLKNTDLLIVHNVITLHKNLALTAALKLISEQVKPALIAWCHDFAWQDTLYTPDLHPGYPWDLLRSPWRDVHYVAVSNHRKHMLADLLGIPGTEITVIPPGIDVDQFLKLSPLTSEIIDHLDLLDADPLVLLPARLTRRKNIEFAIQVIATLKQDYPQVALVITGPPGPHNPKNIAYLESLLLLRKELLLESNIHFLYEYGELGQTKNIPDEVISDFYQISDILLFPSYHEGFGIPILEAGLSRLPIFASDIPPFHESSAGSANFFDPFGDPKEVAKGIQAYIESDQAYRLRKKVLARFTWQSILKNKIIPLIEDKVMTQ